MLKKLRTKFVVITMSLVCIMLVIIFALVYHSTRTDLQRQSEMMMQNVAQSMLQPNPSLPKDVQLPYFTVSISLSGRVTVVGTTRLDPENEDLWLELVQRVYSLPEETGILEEEGLRFCRSPGRNVRVAFLDISSQQTTLNALVRSSILIGLLCFGLFLLASILLARWSVKPVEQAWQQQRQFVSDASHELKTPLTVIMSNAELLQSAPEEAEHYGQNILTVSYRMRNLVEGLLELARADNGQVKKSFGPVNLSQLAEEAVLLFEPVLYEQGLQLESRIQADLWVQGSEQYLGQVIQILLDNAGKYSEPGTVYVGLERQGKNAILWVWNPGIPIPQDQLQLIFHRFYRSDRSRTDRSSFGLGLAIAKSMVEEHGGRIWVNPDPEGNCFRVLLPLR